MNTMFLRDINMSSFDTEKHSTAETEKKETWEVLELTVLEVKWTIIMFVEEGIQWGLC